MKLKTQLFIGLVALALASCNNNATTKPSASMADAADAIYYNGDIITMEGDSPAYAEAVALKDGKIVFVGSKADAEKLHGDSTSMNDLKGKTLVPGFFEGHIHFAALGMQAVAGNLLPGPDGNCDSIDDLVQIMKDWHAKNGTGKTKGWIFGIGFDDAVLKEGRFPTREDLDKVSMDVPVCVMHITGHFCSVNSKALELIKMTAATKDPDGGVIRRMPNSQEPNGVLEEMAALKVLFPIVTPEPELVDFYFYKSQEMAFKFGHTSIQEGKAMGNHEQLASYALSGKLKVDLVSYVDYSMTKYLHSEWNKKEYNHHYRIGGVKLGLDGSPQGRTAWRTIPYLIPPDGQKQGYLGYPIIADDKKVMAIFDTAFANNWQIITHANGDAAVDQLIRCMKPAAAKYGNADRRNVLIHGQYTRMDQLDSLKKLDVVASLYPMHTFYWGDWHKQIIGDSLGNKISPIKSALNKGLHVTSHTDAPVALPNLMMIMWTTVNRVSRSGAIIGADERLTPYEALQSITIWGAYQHFEDYNKGSLKAGKLGDMVVLSENPLKVDKMKIKDIIVLETIKEGKSVYKKQ